MKPTTLSARKNGLPPKETEFDQLQKNLEARQQEIKRANLFRKIRLGLMVGVTIALVTIVWNFFFQVKSYNAFINGKIYALRTPIEGTLKLNNVEVGMPVKQGQVLGIVDNPRASEMMMRQSDVASQLASTQEQLASVRSQVAQTTAQLGQFGSQSGVQKTIRVRYESQNLQTLRHEVEAAQALNKKAQADAVRYARLAELGYAPQSTAETFYTQAKESESRLSQKQSELQQAESKLAAARSGIQVDGSMTASYPDMRRDQLQTQLFQLRMQANQLQLEASMLQNKLGQVSEQSQLAQSNALVSPTQGVVWALDAQSGEAVEANKSVLSVVDCQNLWVDTYIEDSQFQHINVQAPVTVKVLLNGKSQSLQANVETVRAGAGRFTAGQNAIAAPDPKEKSQTLVRLRLPNTLKPSGTQSCAVGSAVEATFRRK